MEKINWWMFATWVIAPIFLECFCGASKTEALLFTIGGLICYLGYRPKVKVGTIAGIKVRDCEHFDIKKFTEELSANITKEMRRPT